MVLLLSRYTRKRFRCVRAAEAGNRVVAIRVDVSDPNTIGVAEARGQVPWIHLLDADRLGFFRFLWISYGRIAKRIIHVRISGRHLRPQVGVLKNADIGDEEPAVGPRRNAIRIAPRIHMSDDRGKVIRFRDLI
jgi:hypothetical protein